MARTYKNKSLVSGMTIKEILNMDNKTFDALNEKDLRQVVGRLVSAGNKRLRTFQRQGETSPAERYIMRESGGMFSTRGKDFGELRTEFKRAKGFLDSETGSIKGWNKVRDETLQSLKAYDIDLERSAIEGLRKQFASDSDFDKWRNQIGEKAFNDTVRKSRNAAFDVFWRAYENLKKSDSSVQAREMKYRVLDAIDDALKDNAQSPDEIAAELKQQLTEIYEKKAIERHADSGTSRFFDLE